MGKSEPESGTESMFSIAHGVAAALLYGKAGPVQFSDDAVRDPQLKELRRRTEVIPDPQCAAGQAKIIVHTQHRGLVTAEVPIQKGYADNPLTDDDVREKFLNLAEPVLGSNRARRAVVFVYGMESLDDAGELARLCA